MSTAAAANPVPAAAPDGAMQTRIEARKNLTAMGVTYHSQADFLAAIRRKDDVAVQLFIDGGGINLNAKDPSGKTPAEIAQAEGATEIATLITNALAKPATVPASPAAQQLPAPTAPATNAPTAAAPEAALPPEMLAEIDAQIAALNLPDDQKKAFRENAIRQMGQIKAFTDRIDPASGRLR